MPWKYTNAYTTITQDTPASQTTCDIPLTTTFLKRAIMMDLHGITSLMNGIAHQGGVQMSVSPSSMKRRYRLYRTTDMDPRPRAGQSTSFLCTVSLVLRLVCEIEAITCQYLVLKRW